MAMDNTTDDPIYYSGGDDSQIRQAYNIPANAQIYYSGGTDPDTGGFSWGFGTPTGYSVADPSDPKGLRYTNYDLSNNPVSNGMASDDKGGFLGNMLSNPVNLAATIAAVVLAPELLPEITGIVGPTAAPAVTGAILGAGKNVLTGGNPLTGALTGAIGGQLFGGSSDFPGQLPATEYDAGNLATQQALSDAGFNTNLPPTPAATSLAEIAQTAPVPNQPNIQGTNLNDLAAQTPTATPAAAAPSPTAGLTALPNGTFSDALGNIYDANGTQISSAASNAATSYGQQQAAAVPQSTTGTTLQEIAAQNPAATPADATQAASAVQQAQTTATAAASPTAGLTPVGDGTFTDSLGNIYDANGVQISSAANNASANYGQQQAAPTTNTPTVNTPSILSGTATDLSNANAYGNALNAAADTSTQNSLTNLANLSPSAALPASNVLTEAGIPSVQTSTFMNSVLPGDYVPSQYAELGSGLTGAGTSIPGVETFGNTQGALMAGAAAATPLLGTPLDAFGNPLAYTPALGDAGTAAAAAAAGSSLANAFPAAASASPLLGTPMDAAGNPISTTPVPDTSVQNTVTPSTPNSLSNVLGTGLSAAQLAALGSAAAQAVGGVGTAQAIKSAQAQQAAAAQQAMGIQQGVYNQQLGMLAPYQQTAQTGLTGLQNNAGYFQNQFNNQDLNAQLAPNYGFMLQQGQMANQRAANVGGGALSGNTLQGLNQYTQNYAQNAYQNAFNNYQTQRNNIYNSLAGIAGLGTSANAQAIGAGNNYATNATNLTTGLAAANAGATVGLAQNTSNTLNNIANNVTLAALLGQKTS